MSNFAGAKLTNLFATPLMAHRWPDTAELNKSLRDKILVHVGAVETASRTNVGGWHSPSGQLEFCGEAGRKLIGWIYEMADETTRRVLNENGHEWRPTRWTLHAWANVNRAGDFNSTHTHPGSTWSGTYYVDIGEPVGGAALGAPLHLFDPCQGRANTFLPPLVPSSLLVRPKPGLMVLFPSYLPHTVFPHRGAGTRISIAFNLRREPFP